MLFHSVVKSVLLNCIKSSSLDRATPDQQNVGVSVSLFLLRGMWVRVLNQGRRNIFYFGWLKKAHRFVKKHEYKLLTTQTWHTNEFSRFSLYLVWRTENKQEIDTLLVKFLINAPFIYITIADRSLPIVICYLFLINSKYFKSKNWGLAGYNVL